MSLSTWRTRYTLIFSQEHGPAISTTFSVWVLILFGFALLLFPIPVGVLLSMPAHWRAAALQHELDAAQQELHSLRQELAAWREQAYESRLNKAALASTKSSASPDVAENEFVPFLEIASASVRTNKNAIEVTFALRGVSQEPRSGWLFAVFSAERSAERQYFASPQVEVNAEGFPRNYKQGAYYRRLDSLKTFRRRISRNASAYTHVTLYAFSFRGGLLLREAFEIPAAEDETRQTLRRRLG